MASHVIAIHIFYYQHLLPAVVSFELLTLTRIQTNTLFKEKSSLCLPEHNITYMNMGFNYADSETEVKPRVVSCLSQSEVKFCEENVQIDKSQTV